MANNDIAIKSSLDIKALLPMFTQEWQEMNSEKMREYQDTLNAACQESVRNLQELIQSGSLALDLEQSVEATKALMDGQVKFLDSKRKLAETMVKCAVMVEALNPPPETKPISLLDEYVLKSRANLSDSMNNSIFTKIEAEATKENKPEESENK